MITLLLADDWTEGLFYAVFDMDEIRDYRGRKMMGNTFRRVDAYRELMNRNIQEPFIRKGQPKGRIIKYIPNMITLSRILAAVIMVLVEPFSIPFWVLYIYAGVSDMIDGTIARISNHQSALGARLDFTNIIHSLQYIRMPTRRLVG